LTAIDLAAAASGFFIATAGGGDQTTTVKFDEFQEDLGGRPRRPVPKLAGTDALAVLGAPVSSLMMAEGGVRCGGSAGQN